MEYPRRDMRAAFRPRVCTSSALAGALAGALAACGGPEPASEGTTSATAATGGATVVATAEIVLRTTNGYRVSGHSVWEGRYVCLQGVTGLTLELTGSGGPSVAAVFRFYAVPENPTVPSGSYSLTGLVRGDGTIDLTPERWFEQPPGYVMVGMTGLLDPTTGIMRGMITNPDCAAFDLHRVR